MPKPLKEILEEGLHQTLQSSRDINWEDPYVYADFLAQTFYFVCHSTRLLAVAASRFPLGEEKLFHRFAAHMNEEKSHEKLARRDLINLGFDLSQFPEKPMTRAFYEAQYYKIEHLSPTALLGYILFLEALAVQSGPLIYPRVHVAHGEKTTLFLKVHVEEDPEHVRQAIEGISAISESSAILREHIEDNLIQSAAQYCFILQNLIKVKAENNVKYIKAS